MMETNFKLLASETAYYYRNVAKGPALKWMQNHLTFLHNKKGIADPEIKSHLKKLQDGERKYVQKVGTSKAK